MMELINNIGNWMHLQLRSRMKDGYILGVSGGVDSYTLARILVKHNIPCKLFHFIYDRSLINDEIINGFKNDSQLKIEIIDSSSIYDSFKALISTINDKTSFQKLLDANIKARIREAIFYNYANINNYLVIGTINKEEFNLGYFVKNSSIGDILPFAGIPKNSIRLMALSLGIEQDVALMKASGCIDKNYAEEEWGITEDEMGNILANDFDKVPIQKVMIYLNKFELNKHKREFPPIFPFGVL